MSVEINRVVASYLTAFPSEEARLFTLTRFLGDPANEKRLYHRKNFAGHITASGFVLSRDHKKLALVRHQFLKRYLQPGGHVEETDPNVLAAARREILEEIGLRDCRYLPFHNDPSVPLDIDTHDIPANPKKDEPKHFHYDFRFLFCAENQTVQGESTHGGETEWVWKDVADAISDETFPLVREKIKRLVNQ